MSDKAYRQLLLRKLYELYMHCNKCPLAHQERTHVVCGEGGPDAPIMRTGEAPGCKRRSYHLAHHPAHILRSPSNKKFLEVNIRRVARLTYQVF
jgi:hypothetical protein